MIPADMTPRRFKLIRRTDITGVSGEGHIADGIQWPDGTCAVRWRTARATHAQYDHIDDVKYIHGHDGATVVEFIDLE